MLGKGGRLPWQGDRRVALGDAGDDRQCQLPVDVLLVVEAAEQGVEAVVLGVEGVQQGAGGQGHEGALPDIGIWIEHRNIQHLEQHGVHVLPVVGHVHEDLEWVGEA